MHTQITSLLKFVVTLSLLCSSGLLYARKVSKADSAWFEAMAASTNLLINDQPEAADSFARAYFKKAQLLRDNDYAGKGACLVQMAVSLLDPGKAHAWYDTAQMYLQRSGNDLWSGYLNMNYGSVLNGQYRFEEGIRYTMQSIAFFEKAKDTVMVAMAYSSLANAFHDLGNFEKGKYYALQGLRIMQPFQSEFHGAQWSLLNVLGINYDDNQEYDLAIATHIKALKAAAGNNQRLSSSYNNLGNTYKKKGLLTEAEKCFQKSKELTTAGSIYHLATLYGNLGDIARQQKRYPTAKLYLDSSLYYAKKSGSPEKLRDVYQYNALLFEATGDYRKSMEYLKQHMHLKDSLESVEKERVIYDMQEKYESRKKEQENRELHLSNDLKSIEKERAVTEKWIILFAAVLFTGLLSILAFILYRNKLNRIRQDDELKMNQALFTGEQNERIRIARDLHDAVGQMLSLAKMNLSSVTEPDPVHVSTIQLIDQTINEVRNISHNLIPEDLNFGLIAALETLSNKVNAAGSTQMAIEIAEDIRHARFEKQTELSIYRIVQEVVSNMTRHARASTIRLSIVRQDAKILLSIRDNGIGMDAGNMEKSDGIGWKNIKARVNLLDGEIRVLSGKLSGTEIEISIPG